MKTNITKRVVVLLAIGFASALALSACKHTGEHPSKEHPAKEHPTKEHPSTNAPPRNP